MIRKIQKSNVNNVYPQIDLLLEPNEEFTISTSIKIKEEDNNYIVVLNKGIKFNDTISHRQLMQFVDSFMVDVNKVRKNFKSEEYKTNGKLCYKIIE